MRDGALLLDGKPAFLTSADYPYYRDDVENWPKKLDLLKDAGVRTITLYTPWRHHQPRQDAAPDFTGATQPNRDVLGFIRMIRERDMLAIVKPGPFIHAELNYGGLPDWVKPTENPAVRPDADHLGFPPSWLITAEILPDFFDPEFRRLTDAWLRAVGDQVIRPNEAPDGPVVGVQILNEGIFSDSAGIAAPGQLTYGGVSSSGYAAPRVADWGGGQPPRNWNPPAALAGARPYVSFALHKGENYRDATVLSLAGLGPLRVPVILNPNPGFNPAGLPNGPDDQVAANGEDWLLRTEADQLENITRGLTNWVGLPQRDPRAYLLYVQGATRDRGPNLEEDWGFGYLYHEAYRKAQPSVFQSVAFTAWGLTGLNFYTGASTTAFERDPELDCYRNVGRCPRPVSLNPSNTNPASHSPYPDAAPINADNTRGHTYAAMEQLASLWNEVGASLVRARPPRNLAWGIYPPYAAAGAWQPLDADWRELGLVGAPHAVFKGSEGFLSSAIATDTQAGQVHLPTASVEELDRWRTLVLAGSRWMDGATQAKLVEYVRRGGTLFMTGDVPVLGGDLTTPDRTLADALLPGARLEVRTLDGPAEVGAFGGRWRAAGAATVLPETGGGEVEARLADGTPVAVSRRTGAGSFVFAGWQPWGAPDHDAAQFDGSVGLAEAVAEQFAGAAPEPGDPSPRVEVNVFRDGRREHVFVLNRSGEPHTVSVGSALVRVAGQGVAQLMLRGRQIVAAYVDGANDLDPERSTEPRVSLGRCSVSASGPADLLALPGEVSLAYAAGGARAIDERDRRASRTRLRRPRLARGGLVLRGRSRDAGCSGHARVLVSIWRRAGRGRCRFVGRRGRLTRARPCRRSVLLRARGTRRWRLRVRRARIPRGVYRVTARGRDGAGNLERRSRRNTARVRIP
jgi:beta-galactosidase